MMTGEGRCYLHHVLRWDGNHIGAEVAGSFLGMGRELGLHLGGENRLGGLNGFDDARHCFEFGWGSEGGGRDRQ